MIKQSFSTIIILRISFYNKIGPHLVSNANLDINCITETWLKDHISTNYDHIKNHTVSVSGYNIIRRDRKVVEQGGV